MSTPRLPLEGVASNMPSLQYQKRAKTTLTLKPQQGCQAHALFSARGGPRLPFFLPQDEAEPATYSSLLLRERAKANAFPLARGGG